MRIKTYIFLLFFSYHYPSLFSLSKYDCAFFYYVCSYGNHLKIGKMLKSISPQKIKSLLAYKDPETKNTPLLNALTNNNTYLSELLLSYNANIHEPNQEGHSPLHIATINGNFEIVNSLLQKKALIDLQAIGTEKTALHYATENNHSDIAALLLASEARTDIADSQKLLPIHYAAKAGNQLITKQLLINNKRIINSIDPYGRTILHYAVQSSPEYLLWFFKNYKKNINFSTQDSHGNTALHYAIYYGDIFSVLYLLVFNSPLSATNTSGFTPLLLAKNLELNEIVRLIEVYISWQK